jgi:HAMP domain-containing protein
VRRIPIHVKLSAALLLPLVGLLGVAGFEVVQSGHQAADLRREIGLAEAVVGPGGLSNALQDERNRATVDLVDIGNLIRLPVPTNADARRATDRAVADFRRLVDDHGPEVQESYAPTLADLDRLAELRDDIDTNAGPFTFDANYPAADEAFGRYTELIDHLIDANADVAFAIDDPDLRRGAEVSLLASRQADAVARLIRHVLITAIGPDGFDQRSEIVELGRLYGRARQGEDAMRLQATGAYAEIAAPVQTALTPLYEQVEHVMATTEVDVVPFLGAMDPGPEGSYDGSFRARVRVVLEADADRMEAASSQRVRLFRLLAALAALVAAVITWMISQSITRPLRSLTRQATRTARHRLPEAVLEVLDTPTGTDVAFPRLAPVRVATRDEVADVAHAVTVVQATALDLAVGQAMLRRNVADSLIGLGRRNQRLVTRQLAFITELEHAETDPAVLADLFRLDHLATRMRRNADSLLVLAAAGAEAEARWAGPVPVTEVIRAALGEVEEYERVGLRAVEPALVDGPAANDLAHLLAELIENGLTYSPPDMAVEVRGRCQLAPRTPRPGGPAVLHQGLAMGYTLAVIDFGAGMKPADIARANRRLAGTEAYAIAPSRYLGHHVAGRLAARHGIAVSLHGTPEDAFPGPGSDVAQRGVTATIRLPAEVVTPAFPTRSEQATVAEPAEAPAVPTPTNLPA